MSVVRHYFMTAAEGKADELAKALETLLDDVRKVQGSEGVELLRDQDNPARFCLLERWESVEAHKGALAQLPKAVIGGFVGALAGPLDGCYLQVLKIA